MPRIASSKSCFTCRKRKLKCGEELPVCDRCFKAKLHCDRKSRINFKPFSPNKSEKLVDCPRDLLRNPHIADLFHIYIKDLAPWYDLNDENCAFEKEGAARALDSPLLFAAVIAFAAAYSVKRLSSTLAVAEEYHAKCLQLLIKLSVSDEEVRNGTALAATCLLRSYEILSEAEDPNRHLFGASTLLPSIPPSIADHSLLASGFWNYLREDITYSLIHECPLKINVESFSGISMTRDDFANAMTLFLARAINLHFDGTNTVDAIQILREEFMTHYMTHKPQPFASYTLDQDDFPTIKMLRDTEAAALHYHLVVQCMFASQDRDAIAAEMCGSTMSSLSTAVIVNAYGPICFTCKWLTRQSQRHNLVRWLHETQKETAWTTKAIVEKLQAAWTDQISK